MCSKKNHYCFFSIWPNKLNVIFLHGVMSMYMSISILDVGFGGRNKILLRKKSRKWRRNLGAVQRLVLHIMYKVLQCNSIHMGVIMCLKPSLQCKLVATSKCCFHFVPFPCQVGTKICVGKDRVTRYYTPRTNDAQTFIVWLISPNKSHFLEDRGGDILN
jgi:hypothetical protein